MTDYDALCIRLRRYDDDEMRNEAADAIAALVARVKGLEAKSAAIYANLTEARARAEVAEARVKELEAIDLDPGSDP